MAELAKDIQVQRNQRALSRNQQALRLLVMPIEKAAPPSGEPGHSKSIHEDPFRALSETGSVIEPPFDMLTLAMLEEQNTELTPILETMETNIDGFGHHIQSRVDAKEATTGTNSLVRSEFVRLTNFFHYANLRDSFTALRRKLRRDIESTGNGYWEVIRDAKGGVQGFEHLPSAQIRLTPTEDKHVEVDVPTLQLQGDGSFEIENIKAWHRFRKFVQSSLTPFKGFQATTGGFKMRWYKEFGDPRVYDNRSGEPVPDEQVANWKGTGKVMPESERANELIHFKLYSSRTPYGLPRHIGNLLSIFGARAAEEINYITFRNNNIPSMGVLVSNGQLTEGTLDRIESFVESQIQGSDNYSKFLIIEGEPGDVDGEDSGHIKIEMVPLTGTQHKDALFQNYTKNNQTNVLRSFRIPPIFVGSSLDYSRACYSDDTETLTENGWRFWEEVQPDERIATLNPETGELQYRVPVGGVRVYDYEGEMIRFHNRNTDLLVTPDHTMWTRPLHRNGSFEKVHAEDIEWSRFAFQSAPIGYEPTKFDGDAFVFESVDIRGGPNTGVRPEVRLPLPLFARFVAAFVADGCTTPEFVNGKRRCMYNIQMNASKQRKIDMFAELYAELKAAGFRVFEPCTTGGMTTFVLADKGLWAWLRENCGVGALTKRIPYWMLHDPRCSEEMLRVLQNTDGTVDSRPGRTSWSYSSSSRELADQVQILALHSGCRAHLITTKGEGNRRDNHRVLIVPNSPTHKVTSDQASSEWYSGQVYCFEVPNHLFFVRRNGRVSVQGNTAETSRKLADEQVFAPERNEFDAFINRRLFPEMGVLYHRYVSNSPNTTDNAELVSILAGAEKTGGMSPEIARIVLEDILGRELPDFPKDDRFDPKIPFSLLMAEAVKNQADPTQPGQQVTALKRVQDIMGLDAADDVPFEERLMPYLIRLRKKLETDWEGRISDLEHDDS